MQEVNASSGIKSINKLFSLIFLKFKVYFFFSDDIECSVFVFKVVVVKMKDYIVKICFGFRSVENRIILKEGIQG